MFLLFFKKNSYQEEINIDAKYYKKEDEEICLVSLLNHKINMRTLNKIVKKKEL